MESAQDVEVEEPTADELPAVVTSVEIAVDVVFELATLVKVEDLLTFE